MGLPSNILAAVCAALVVAIPAHALDPARSIAQYKHTRWTIDDGAPAPLKTMAQGRDGYLWVSGKDGIYRFDGIRFERISVQAAPAGQSSVYTMLVTRNGDVWMGDVNGGSSVYRDGVLKEMPMPDAAFVMDMVETPDGSIWATLGRKVRQLYRFDGGRWAEVGTQLGFPPNDLAKMIATRDGTILITTIGGGFYRLRPGARRFERTSDVLVGHAALVEDKGGNIWVSDDSGTRRLQFGPPAEPLKTSIPYRTPATQRRVLTIFDRDGNLWGMNEDGVYRLRRPLPGGAVSTTDAIDSVSRYQAMDGLISGPISAILEDREGNIWVSSTVGLERFRAAAVIVEPALTNRAIYHDVLLGASDGTVYVGESDAVYRIRPGGKPEPILRVKESLALCEAADGAIWMVVDDRVVRMQGDRFTSFAAPISNTDVTDCAVDAQNQIWVTAERNGLFRRVGQSWQQSMVPPATGGAVPTTLLRRHDGKMLVVAETLAVADPPAAPRPLISPGLGIESIRTIFEAPERLMFGGPFGIGEIGAGQVRLLSSKRFPVLRNVAGIAATPNGQIWAVSAAGPFVMSAAALDRALADPNAPLPVRLFDFRDGLTSAPGLDDIRAIVAGGDGRVWVSTGTGTVSIDSRNLARNTIVPPVRISAISVDGDTIRDPVAVQLKAGAKNIEINFAALSLSMPERVQVRYRLIGDDQGWIDPGMRRQAFYTNLGPGHHAFQVIAANNDGVWNRKGATLEFDIPPTFLQSNWFLALCIAGIGLLLWLAYRIRVRQLTGRMRERLEQRLAERERIARDLHDTLLQGFQGLILRFQSVANEIPENLRAHGLLGEALDTADMVLREGRDSVSLLRTVERTDIAATLSDTAKRMSASYPAEFQMVVEGTPRTLHAIVRSEVCRIGEEAIINAFQHAKASVIEVALSFGANDLTLGIRDNGIGIDTAILDKGGRQGHFGLVGMQERATQIDADFSVSSRPGAGTEINLTVPGKIAYVSRYRKWWRLGQGNRWMVGAPQS